MGDVILELIWRRAAPWAAHADAPRGYLSGTVSVAGSPSSREVEVRHRQSRNVVATTFSAGDGTWLVLDLPSLDEYDVHVRDFTRAWKDYIEPAVVPVT